MAETIFLQPRKKTTAEIRAGLPVPLQILTSLKTTAVLGGILGTLLAPARALGLAKTAGKMLIPKTAKGALITAVSVPTAIGVLGSSKKARDIVKTTLDPRESIKRGKKLGEIIEDPSKAKDVLGIKKGQTTKEKIIAGAKSAGKAGAVIAGGIAVVGAVRKGKEILEKRKAEQIEAVKQLTPETKALGFTDPQPVGLGGVPVAVRQPLSPTEAPQQQKMIKPIQNIIQIQVQ